MRVAPLVDPVDEQDRPLVVERGLHEIPRCRSALLRDPRLNGRHNRVRRGAVKVTAQDPNGSHSGRSPPCIRWSAADCGSAARMSEAVNIKKLDCPTPVHRSVAAGADSVHSSTGVRARSGSADRSGSRRGGRRVCDGASSVEFPRTLRAAGSTRGTRAALAARALTCLCVFENRLRIEDQIRQPLRVRAGHSRGGAPEPGRRRGRDLGARLGRRGPARGDPPSEFCCAVLSAQNALTQARPKKSSTRRG